MSPSDAWSYIIAAVIAGFFALAVTMLQVRASTRLATKVSEVHDEVRTNHGVRQGQRIEDLGVDVAWIRGQMVTKQELADHTKQDAENFREIRGLIKP